MLIVFEPMREDPFEEYNRSYLFMFMFLAFASMAFSGGFLVGKAFTFELCRGCFQPQSDHDT